MRYYSNINAIKKRSGGDKNTEWVKGGLLVLAIVLSLCFFTAERMLWGHLKYELDQVKILQQKLTQVTRQLRMEKASLEHPGRLVQEARKMGLKPPRKEQVIPY